MFGSHLSIAGGMVHALTAAQSRGMDCVQVFTKNQRQWSVKPLANGEVDSWLNQLRGMGWDNTNRIVSHNSYLVNLASPDTDSRNRSIALQREEIERCERLHIPALVSHPGARLGTPRKTSEKNNIGGEPTKEELDGLTRLATSLDQLHKELPNYKTRICLETTVGSGTNLGYDFRHLAMVRNEVSEPERVAYCFDTCHVTAAGFDMHTEEKAESVLQQFDDIAGLDLISVFHFNDSIGGVGSRKDRHAHIGQGTCGLACFRAILKNPRFDHVPKILETSKEENEQGILMDVVNISKLRSMQIRARKRR